MLDFSELGEDGAGLVRLARELLLVAGLDVRWACSGRGTGTDLLAEEDASGPLGTFRRRWLVECRHTALAGVDAEVGDLATVAEACRRRSADGYLLVCTTAASAEAAAKLAAIAARPLRPIATACWDAVALERRLREPRAFALARAFFPASMQGTAWSVYNAGSPTRWAAHYEDAFLYLSSGTAYFPALSEVEEIVRRLRAIEPRSRQECIRPRAVHFDDERQQFTAFADYLVPDGATPTLSPRDFERQLRDGEPLYRDGEAAWYETWWDVALVRTSPASDRYRVDGAAYYEPHLRNFELGVARRGTIGDTVRWT
jgi:hypothetical protein